MEMMAKTLGQHSSHPIYFWILTWNGMFNEKNVGQMKGLGEDFDKDFKNID